MVPDSKSATTVTLPSDRELVATRVFDAPRELVFKAWTDPNHLVHWWGPKGFTNTFQEFDPSPGGTWRYIMHSPDGVDHPNLNVFVDIVIPERIVFQHVSDPKFQATVTFTEDAGRTALTMRMLFESVAEYDTAKGYAAEGNHEMFDRLAARLTTMG